MTMKDERARKRRILLMFWAHIGLALAIMAWFVFSVAHR